MREIIYLRVFLISILLSFQLTSFSQTKKTDTYCQLIIETRKINIDWKKSFLIIKRDPGGDTIVNGKLLKQQSTFIIKTNEPFFGHAELLINNGIYSMSSSFLI